MSKLKPIGSEKQKGIEKFQRIMQIARDNTTLTRYEYKLFHNSQLLTKFSLN
jgi:hypothetical protein